MATTATMHPRVRLIPDLFGPPLRRAMQRGFRGGIAIGIVAGLALATAVPSSGAKPVALVVVVALVSAGSGVVIRMASIPRTIRAPHEAFAWLGAAEVRRFEDRTGSKAPFDAVAMRTWLDRHPSTPATVLARAELLGTLGDLPGARAELAAAPEIPADDLERVERATLTVWLGFLETGDADLGPLDTVAATTAPGSPAGLAAAVSRALAETRLRLDRGAPDPLAPLTAVRPGLGTAATWVVIRRGSRSLVKTLLVLGAGLGALMALADAVLGYR